LMDELMDGWKLAEASFHWISIGDLWHSLGWHPARLTHEGRAKKITKYYPGKYIIVRWSPNFFRLWYLFKSRFKIWIHYLSLPTSITVACCARHTFTFKLITPYNTASWEIKWSTYCGYLNENSARVS
jgi:hypothetical protein